METNELKTAAYLKEEPTQPVPSRQPLGPGGTALLRVISGFIIFCGALLMICGHFGVLFSEADLFQLPNSDGQFTPSPLSGFTATTKEMWILYAGAMAMFVVGAVCVGSQPANAVIGVVYILCPLALVAWAVGWPLRQRSGLRDWMAAIYLGVGVAVGVAAWYGIQSQLEKPHQDQIILYSFALQFGLSLLAGGLLAWMVELFRSRPEDQPS